jgi:hypothetical protein
MIIISHPQYNFLLQFDEILGTMSQLALDGQFPCHKHFGALPNPFENGGLGILISLN